MRPFWFSCVLILLMVAPTLAQEQDSSVPVIVGDMPIRLAYQAYLNGGDENRLWVLNDAGEAVEIAAGLHVNSETLDAAWSHDCSRLAFSAYAPENLDTYRGSLYIYDFASGALSIAYESFQYLPTDLEWSPDDEWIGHRQYGEENYTIGVLNVDLGVNVLIASQPDLFFDGWLDQESLIMTLAHRIDQYTVDRRVLFTEIDSGAGALETLVENHVNVVPSPDGDHLLITHWADDNTTYQLSLYSADGEFISKLADNVSTLYPAWSPDSRHAAFLDVNNALSVVDTETRRMTSLDDVIRRDPNARGVASIQGWTRDGSAVLVHMRVDDPLTGAVNMNQALYAVAADGSEVQEVVTAVSGEIGFYWYLPCDG